MRVGGGVVNTIVAFVLAIQFKLDLVAPKYATSKCWIRRSLDEVLLTKLEVMVRVIFVFMIWSK